jgi:lysozyme
LSAKDLAEPIIRRHEGTRSKIYKDTVGVPTIGIGRNLEDPGLSDDEIEYLFANDMQRAHETASAYSYWDTLTDTRKAALIDMAFQLGPSRLAGFVNMHRALALGDYVRAAIECFDSLYAKQVPDRANEIASMIWGDE